MDKESVVHVSSGTVQSHRKNEMLPFEATWVEVENSILREISQTQKHKYSTFSFMCGS
jgi:hypothetical protein